MKLSKDFTGILLDFKARQLAGDKVCPRCGLEAMKPNLYTNAYSRHADIYICDTCGTDEALLDFMQNPLPLQSWACFEPNRPASDFKTRTTDDVRQALQAGQLTCLKNLYQRWLEHPDDSELIRRKAFESCPGLTQLWCQPFLAAYDAADGQVLVRFRKTEQGLEAAIDLNTK